MIFYDVLHYFALTTSSEVVKANTDVGHKIMNKLQL